MRKYSISLLILSLFAVVGLSITAVLGQTAVDAHDAALVSDDGVSVTLYNEGSALVQDRRTFDLRTGLNLVNFTDIAATIDSTSVNFVSLTDPTGTVVLEQNYVYDLVNSAALVERYLDEQIEITTVDSKVYAGQLLTGRGSFIIRADDGEVIEVENSFVRDLRFPDLPDALITRPTLRWLISAAQDGPQQVELTYLTSGMGWTADYNLLLATDNASVDVNGWVTLNNRSGTTYTDAQLKLVAGDVNRIQPQADRSLAAPMAPPGTMTAMATPAVQQREFFEYQLYEVSRAVTVGDNQTKQVEFVTETGVPATTFYVYDGSPRFGGYRNPIVQQNYGITSVAVVDNYLEFTTDEEDGLGADLPAGRVRVYQEDVDGAALFIRQGRIDHTPEGEDVEVFLGTTVDLTGSRTQTDFTLVSNTVLQETVEIRLRNFKDTTPVEIRVPERLNRWSNWEILSSSHEFEQVNAHAIEFRVDVSPRTETVLTYTVQYSWLP